MLESEKILMADVSVLRLKYHWTLLLGIFQFRQKDISHGNDHECFDIAADG